MLQLGLCLEGRVRVFIRLSRMFWISADCILGVFGRSKKSLRLLRFFLKLDLNEISFHLYVVGPGRNSLVFILVVSVDLVWWN